MVKCSRWVLCVFDQIGMVLQWLCVEVYGLVGELVFGWWQQVEFEQVEVVFGVEQCVVVGEQLGYLVGEVDGYLLVQVLFIEVVLQYGEFVQWCVVVEQGVDQCQGVV